MAKFFLTPIDVSLAAAGDSQTVTLGPHCPPTTSLAIIRMRNTSSTTSYYGNVAYFAGESKKIILRPLNETIIYTNVNVSGSLVTANGSIESTDVKFYLVGYLNLTDAIAATSIRGDDHLVDITPAGAVPLFGAWGSYTVGTPGTYQGAIVFAYNDVWVENKLEVGFRNSSWGAGVDLYQAMYNQGMMICVPVSAIAGTIQLWRTQWGDYTGYHYYLMGYVYEFEDSPVRTDFSPTSHSVWTENHHGFTRTDISGLSLLLKTETDMGSGGGVDPQVNFRKTGDATTGSWHFEWTGGGAVGVTAAGSFDTYRNNDTKTYQHIYRWGGFINTDSYYGGEGEPLGHPFIMEFPSPGGGDTDYSIDSIVCTIEYSSSSAFTNNFFYVWYSTDNGSSWTEVTCSANRVGWLTETNTRIKRDFLITGMAPSTWSNLQIKIDGDVSYYAMACAVRIWSVQLRCEYTPNTVLTFTGAPLSGTSPVTVTFDPTLTDGDTDDRYIVWNWGLEENEYEDADTFPLYQDPPNQDHTYTTTVSSLRSVEATFSGEMTSALDDPVFTFDTYGEPEYIDITGGSGGTPALRYPLGDLDFGTHAIGETGVSETLTIYNDGDGDLTISSIWRIGGASSVFVKWSGYAEPIIVPAMGSTPIIINYRYDFPGPVGTYTTNWQVNSDDPTHPTAPFDSTIIVSEYTPTFSASLMRHLKYFLDGLFRGCLIATRSNPG